MRRAAPYIYYELAGRRDAPVLVMVRGLGRSLRHWLDLPERLASSFRLVLIDNRGIGRSDPAPPTLTVTDMADDVALVLDRAGIERCHLFGVSLGGMIAQRFALRHAHRLERLVIGCSTPGGRHALRPARATFARMVYAATRPRAEALRLSATIALSAAFRARTPDIVERWVALDAQAPLARRTLIAQGLAGLRHDAWDELPHLRVPTLLVCGDADELLPPENSRLLARRIPGAELLWLPGAGHDFPTEDPERTAAILRAFLLSPEARA